MEYRVIGNVDGKDYGEVRRRVEMRRKGKEKVRN